MRIRDVVALDWSDECHGIKVRVPGGVFLLGDHETMDAVSEREVDRRFSNLWYVECVLPEGTIMITDMDWYYSKTPKKASGSGDKE